MNDKFVDYSKMFVYLFIVGLLADNYLKVSRQSNL